MATPKIIPYTVKLRSVVPEKTFSKPPVVYTNDLRSAEFQFKITDMDAGELSTATATTLLYMRDGSFFQNPSTDVSRVGNVFSYLLKENEGNHAGIAKIQLVVYFNEASANEQNFPTQLYEFEIINGLETKVAQEVMIYDWTTLTREARAYIDEFAANEILREAEFDNNEFDRNTAFVASQDARTLAFGTEQTDRVTAFTAEQNARTMIFNKSESDRATAESEHKASTENPHSVTKAQVGLGNVDNTSDANKPVSVAMQTALDLKANKVQEEWITPTLTNGWTTHASLPTLKYYKDTLGIVHLSGFLALGALSTTLATLPDGYRPQQRYNFEISTKGAPGTVLITYLGAILVERAGTEWVSFNGITFKAEQ